MASVEAIKTSIEIVSIAAFTCIMKLNTFLQIKIIVPFYCEIV